jgi:trehalose/maltose transport system permease protein
VSQQVRGAARTAPARARISNAPQGAYAKGRERLAWMLMVPTVAIVVLVAFYPLLNTFLTSFTNERLGSTREVRWVGLDNYTDLLTDRTFGISIWNTLVFAVSSVALETVLGMIIALVINSNFRGRGLVRTAMLVPWAIPTVVSAQMWRWMYDGVNGVINDFLVTRLGLFPEKIGWLADPALTMGAMIAVDVWKTTPFMALLLLAGLQVISGDIYEAAYVDGANRWQQFWTMTLPLVRPALLVALIFRTLDSLRVFDLPFVMKGAALETITMAVYARQTMIDRSRLGEGSAISVVIFFILLIFVIAYVRLVKVEEA